MDYAATLSDDANGLVVADAIQLLPLTAAQQAFTWTASLPKAGDYDVYARWPADAGRSSGGRAPSEVAYLHGDRSKCPDTPLIAFLSNRALRVR